MLSLRHSRVKCGGEGRQIDSGWGDSDWLKKISKWGTSKKSEKGARGRRRKGWWDTENAQGSRDSSGVVMMALQMMQCRERGNHRCRANSDSRIEGWNSVLETRMEAGTVGNKEGMRAGAEEKISDSLHSNRTNAFSNLLSSYSIHLNPRHRYYLRPPLNPSSPDSSMLSPLSSTPPLFSLSSSYLPC